ncbi:Uncharacterised protein [Vibrio cholerae]|nr:Uncharacterised protein [Vibrio cholerae]CSI38540.1 Uncharacterised protein [Vibrio cholerae]
MTIWLLTFTCCQLLSIIITVVLVVYYVIRWKLLSGRHKQLKGSSLLPVAHRLRKKSWNQGGVLLRLLAVCSMILVNLFQTCPSQTKMDAISGTHF